ncbi:MAG: hypothetical protein J6S53_00835 [Lentisphaeria bacterium]|nr:hypothetical protein [Lentisphaeria bacterium]
MKKSIFLAVVAIFAAGTLFADELKINGEFKVIDPKTKLPASWVRNGVKTGISEVIRKGDDNILKLKNEKGYFAMYSTVKIPAKAGETYKFEIKAKGKGSLSVGYYAYGSKGHCGTGGQSVKVDSSLLFKEYKGTFTIAPPYKGKDLTYIAIQFGSYSAMDVEIEEIEVEKIIQK